MTTWKKHFEVCARVNIGPNALTSKATTSENEHADRAMIFAGTTDDEGRPDEQWIEHCDASDRDGKLTGGGLFDHLVAVYQSKADQKKEADILVMCLRGGSLKDVAMLAKELGSNPRVMQAIDYRSMIATALKLIAKKGRSGELTETDLCRFTLTALTSSVKVQGHTLIDAEILAIRSEFTKKPDDNEGEVVVFGEAGACQRMQRKREDVVQHVKADDQDSSTIVNILTPFSDDDETPAVPVQTVGAGGGGPSGAGTGGGCTVPQK